MTTYRVRATVVPRELNDGDSLNSRKLLDQEHTVEFLQGSGAGIMWAMELATRELRDFDIIGGLDLTEVPEEDA